VEPLTEVRRAVPETARQQVTALYQAHALGLVRLAVLMVGDQQTAEDVVQEAFFGLYRRWPALKDPERALAYARSSVLNGCRMALRARFRRDKIAVAAPDDIESAEATALLGEASREVIAALGRLPARQRQPGDQAAQPGAGDRHRRPAVVMDLKWPQYRDPHSTYCACGGDPRAPAWRRAGLSGHGRGDASDRGGPDGTSALRPLHEAKRSPGHRGGETVLPGPHPDPAC